MAWLRPTRTARAGRRRAARLRHARRRAAAPGRRSSPSGWTRLARRMDERGLRPPRRVGRSRAQRQPRLPHAVRPAVRGGGADRRRNRRPGDPRRQRVLRHGRGRAAADAAASASRTSACPASRATRRRRCPRSSPRGHQRGQPGRRRRLEDVREPRHDRGAGVPRRRAAPGDGPTGWSRTPTDLLIDAGRRAARHQRGRAAGRVRVGGVPDIARRPQPPHRTAARA